MLERFEASGTLIRAAGDPAARHMVETAILACYDDQALLWWIQEVLLRPSQHTRRALRVQGNPLLLFSLHHGSLSVWTVYLIVCLL